MAPRKSVWTRLKKSFGLWFGGIWLVAGLPFLVAAIYLFYDDRRYETEGRIAQGTVLTKEVQRSRSSSSSYTTSYYVTYRFTAPEDQTVEGRDQLGQSQWDALTERGPVQIAYLPSSVSSNRVLGQTHLMLKVIFGILGGFFPLVGGAILFLTVRRAWIESRVQHAGLIVPATVTSVQPTRLEINGRPQWRLEYSFEDLSGRPQTRHVTISPEDASEWDSGDRGIIRVDPDRPTRVVWIGKPES